MNRDASASEDRHSIGATSGRSPWIGRADCPVSGSPVAVRHVSKLDKPVVPRMPDLPGTCVSQGLGEPVRRVLPGPRWQRPEVDQRAFGVLVPAVLGADLLRGPV